jgi:signal transduction histidine kinase
MSFPLNWREYEMTEKGNERERPLALVVDDDANMRLLVGACLEQAGFAVMKAEDGVQAVAEFGRIQPDIVLLDVRMPKVDGFTVCEMIREMKGGKHVPILMITGLEAVESINRAYEAGATDFTTKPINFSLLPHRALYLLRASRAVIELEEAYENLKVLDMAKDAFLSSVSHELRTPLTSIRSFSEILLSYDDTDAWDRKEFVRIINVESERLTRLIDDVLDLSKIKAGKMVWNDQIISLEEIAKEVGKVHEPFLRERSLRLKTDFSTGLPAVFVDRDRIQQVITNLLSNAIKFSPAGGLILIRAEIFPGRRFGESLEWIKMSVSDRGAGIDERDRTSIFEKFNQGSCDTLTNKPKGTGLGLPISREIISHYGGNIWVESEQGSGSTFFFTLPAAAPSTQKAEDPHSTGDATSGWGADPVSMKPSDG